MKRWSRQPVRKHVDNDGHEEEDLACESGQRDEPNGLFDPRSQGRGAGPAARRRLGSLPPSSAASGPGAPGRVAPPVCPNLRPDRRGPPSTARRGRFGHGGWLSLPPSPQDRRRRCLSLPTSSPGSPGFLGAVAPSLRLGTTNVHPTGPASRHAAVAATGRGAGPPADRLGLRALSLDPAASCFSSHVSSRPPARRPRPRGGRRAAPTLPEAGPWDRGRASAR